GARLDRVGCERTAPLRRRDRCLADVVPTTDSLGGCDGAWLRRADQRRRRGRAGAGDGTRASAPEIAWAHAILGRALNSMHGPSGNALRCAPAIRRNLYPSSKLVTPKIRSSRNAGMAPVYMRAVSNTGASPKPSANATASRLTLGTSRNTSPLPTFTSRAAATAAAAARSSANRGPIL